jgi:hypothetical protein
MTDQVAGKYTPTEAREMADAFAFTAAPDNDHGRIAATLRAFAALVDPCAACMCPKRGHETRCTCCGNLCLGVGQSSSTVCAKAHTPEAS